MTLKERGHVFDIPHVKVPKFLGAELPPARGLKPLNKLNPATLTDTLGRVSPPTVVYGGTSFVTTEKAATAVPSPMLTPRFSVTFCPSQTSFPITGYGFSKTRGASTTTSISVVIMKSLNIE